MAGRRTYTEDELQAALRDIQSGKLGTRRAAVIYGIPRSTLRNKVYKLAMERERDAHLVLPVDKDDDDLPEDDEDKDSGAEEEREVEKELMRPIISIDDFMRLSGESGGYPGSDSLRTLLQHGKKEDGSPSPPVYPVFPSHAPELWNGLDHNALGPYISRLLTPTNPFVMTASKNSPTERTPTDPPADFISKLSQLDIVRRMMLEQEQKKERFLNGSRLDEPGPSSSLCQEDENSGSGTSPNVILRIPSFKPTPKNGLPSEASVFSLGLKAGESNQHSLSSPPTSVGRSESSSPPSLGKGVNVSLRDVIAKSISQKFQQPGDLHHITHPPPGFEHFAGRRTDYVQQLGCSPPIMRNHNNNHVDDRKMAVPTTKSSSGNGTSSSTGGKGTRPKRGKYRNYDRDSLVEAVRAVQRGEMSVHRAGSYYGVPHSTLEYKVKERHLMRPRKRESKSVQEEIKLKEDSIVSRIAPSVDKCKLIPPTKPPTAPFTSSPGIPGPNGLKLPHLYDPTMSFNAASHGYPFWHASPFPPLHLDYARNPNFPPTPDRLFTSHMIQRLQEDSSRTPHSPPPTLGKTTRELAETLYDGSGTHGSFLDGIIRSSLESSGLPVRGKETDQVRLGAEMSNKALLDQLCRNSMKTPVPKAEGSSSEDENSKRALNQKRPCEEVSETMEVDEKLIVAEEQDPGPVLEETPEDSNTNNVDVSACDSNHTITRVKLEQET